MKMKLHETKNDLRAKTRRAMIDLLNQELADVLDLGLQAKQAHWNVKVHSARADTGEGEHCSKPTSDGFRCKAAAATAHDSSGLFGIARAHRTTETWLAVRIQPRANG